MVFETIRAVRLFGVGSRLAESGRSQEALDHLKKGLVLLHRPTVNQRAPWNISCISTTTTLFAQLVVDGKVRATDDLRTETADFLRKAIELIGEHPPEAIYMSSRAWMAKALAYLEPSRDKS